MKQIDKYNLNEFKSFFSFFSYFFFEDILEISEYFYSISKK